MCSDNLWGGGCNSRGGEFGGPLDVGIGRVVVGIGRVVVGIGGVVVEIGGVVVDMWWGGCGNFVGRRWNTWRSGGGQLIVQLVAHVK